MGRIGGTVRRLIVAVLILSTPACGSRERLPHPTPSAVLAEIADAASARWYHATGLDPILNVWGIRVGDCDAVIGPTTSSKTYWGCWSGEDRCVVVDYRAPETARYLVLTHELGHSLGAAHPDSTADDPGSVMAEFIADDARCLSRRDVDAVCGPGASVKCRWRRPECER